MAQIKITLPRLRLIRARQSPDRWGANYVASIWATPQEAPSISIASILTPARLGGRDFHCLSKPEASASLLALYNPNVWDLHEQKMMSVTARPHYLYGHEMCVGMQFPALQGTVDVADRLGTLKKHPKVTVRKPGMPGEVFRMPFPYIGDLLLFVQDDRGPYLVNWPIKDKEENFRRQSPRPFGQPRAHGDDETARVTWRDGVCMMFGDEFQFTNQGDANARVTKILLQLRGIGPPFLYCCNYSLRIGQVHSASRGCRDFIQATNHRQKNKGRSLVSV